MGSLRFTIGTSIQGRQRFLKTREQSISSMTDIEQLDQILQAFVMVSALPDFVGKDEVERNLRWAAKNYAERIYKSSYTEN